MVLMGTIMPKLQAIVIECDGSQAKVTVGQNFALLTSVKLFHAFLAQVHI